MRRSTGARDPTALLTIAFRDDAIGVGGWRIDTSWREFPAQPDTLNADERARCDAMTASTPAHLRRAAHAFKREVVGAYLGEAPALVPFATGGGAPRLLPPHQGTHVSLSHALGAVAVAVSATHVGVDIEMIARADNVVRLASRYFAPMEGVLITQVADPRFEFAWRWTAKEALLKACGLSLSDALATSLGDTPRSRTDAPFILRARAAHITVLMPAPGYVCSVARR